ncbi:ribosomal protein S6 [Acrasis kona]|uniref:Ribosomal protein S6 n=1 Tax=Acrasis kona TaxID=1008807 RepID=A0AAW2ZCL0_9EUKA
MVGDSCIAYLGKYDAGTEINPKDSKKGAQITYKHGKEALDYERRLTIRLLCDPKASHEQSKTLIEHEGQVPPSGKKDYYEEFFAMVTPYACPGPRSNTLGGLGYGGLIMRLLSLLVLYFIIGALVLKFYVKKETLPELIPNKDFWFDLPHLVLGGLLFIKELFVKYVLRRGSYSEILIASPDNGTNKIFEITEEINLRTLYDRKLSDEFDGSGLGNEFKGYHFKIVGGQDKDGFPMKQGVLVASRVKLLLERGDVGFQKWRGRKGERRRKSVRGCILGPDMSVVQLSIVKKGDAELPGLTDNTRPRSLGPKRASKIRKLFNLSKEDNVRKYVVKHKKKIGKKEGVLKGPKIQRLITPERLRRRVVLRNRMAARREKTATEREQYATLLKKRKREANDASKERKKAKKAQAEATKQTTTA